MSSTDIARAAAVAALSRKAEEIVILDMSRVSSYCDAFVVCQASNRRQVRAVAEGIMEDLRSHGRRLVGMEGLDASRWVLLDFGDVIVHVFDEPMRGFYDLESLWADARVIDIPGVTAPRLRHGAAAESARTC